MRKRGSRPISRRQRFLRRVLLFVGIVAGLVVVEEAAFRFTVPDVCCTGHNGIWLRHSWVDKPHTGAEYQRLAKRLKALDVRDVYVHAGPLRSDGSVPPKRYAYAREFLAAVHRLASGVRVQAWLGQVEALGGGPLDLSLPKTREATLEVSRRFLDLGFDGIHYDIEPVCSGNDYYVQLLRSAHKLTRARRAVLSVAAWDPEPVPGLDRLTRVFFSNPDFWTKDYFLKIAGEVDQVTVMCYDSGIPLPGLYGRSIAWTTEWAVRNGVKDLVIGVPTYGKAGPSHMVWIENIGNAIAGIKHGTAALPTRDRARVGAAIFAEWTTSKEEQRVFEREWLGRD